MSSLLPLLLMFWAIESHVEGQQHVFALLDPGPDKPVPPVKPAPPPGKPGPPVNPKKVRSSMSLSTIGENMRMRPILCVLMFASYYFEVSHAFTMVRFTDLGQIVSHYGRFLGLHFEINDIVTHVVKEYSYRQSVSAMRTMSSLLPLLLMFWAIESHVEGQQHVFALLDPGPDKPVPPVKPAPPPGKPGPPI
ncbi:hypothetical protein R6Q59_029840 [Mikania micrantha]